jgi:hypothetical protein
MTQRQRERVHAWHFTRRDMLGFGRRGSPTREENLGDSACHNLLGVVAMAWPHRARFVANDAASLVDQPLSPRRLVGKSRWN